MEAVSNLLETIEIETGPTPRAAVIWMHGLGADGHDFEPIVPELDLDGAPPIRFVFPHAPMRPVTINAGAVMRAWYDILGVGGVRREDEQGVRASQRDIEALIEREKRRDIPAARIVLAGFSQGGAMALQTGLRHPERLAGLLILSSALPLADTLAVEAHAANRDVPIFMAHGTHDPVVRFEWAELSRKTLVDAGWKVEWHAYPMEHAAVPEEIEAVGAFLRKVLA